MSCVLQQTQEIIQEDQQLAPSRPSSDGKLDSDVIIHFKTASELILEDSCKRVLVSLIMVYFPGHLVVEPHPQVRR